MDKIITADYRVRGAGTGSVTVDLDVFLPCGTKELRKLLRVIRRNRVTCDKHIEAIKVYIANEIEVLKSALVYEDDAPLATTNIRSLSIEKTSKMDYMHKVEDLIRSYKKLQLTIEKETEKWK